MEEAVFISICIPAYKRVTFLKRLLDSIESQTYRRFEVVITDDSPDNDVSDICQSHALAASIRYFRNEKQLGTPENWNESIRRAAGVWIKLMHDDDWFRDPKALDVFADAVKKNPAGNFFFCEYSNVLLDDRGTEQEIRLPRDWQRRLEKDPKSLLSSNRIGPPSVVLHKKSPDIQYDSTLKWLVDIDFYIRFLQHSKPWLIPENLISVGLGKDQVTKLVFRNPRVEVPENLYVLNKIGVGSLRNIVVYDAFWRFVRNLNIRSTKEVREYGYEGEIPVIIRSMINFQSSIPAAILKTGIFSKFFMAVHYTFHYSKINRG